MPKRTARPLPHRRSGSSWRSMSMKAHDSDFQMSSIIFNKSHGSSHCHHGHPNSKQKMPNTYQGAHTESNLALQVPTAGFGRNKTSRSRIDCAKRLPLSCDAFREDCTGAAQPQAKVPKSFRMHENIGTIIAKVLKHCDRNRAVTRVSAQPPSCQNKSHPLHSCLALILPKQ